MRFRCAAPPPEARAIGPRRSGFSERPDALRARDRRAAYREATDGAGEFSRFSHDAEALVERGEPIPDLSE
jgi:hypothetical protein